MRDIGAGRPFALDLRHRVLLVLFYYRTYVSQDVAGAVFGIGQASVSRSISLTEPLLKQCLPIPEKIYEGSKRISSVEELEELFPKMVCMTDASEQQISRPKLKDMEKSHYSGKAGTHTAKVQYTIGIRGDITYKTPHSPGRANDISIYQMKHPTFWSGGKDGERLRHYLDRGYQGAQHVDAGTEVILPIKKNPGGKLTDEQKEYNRIHSKIRVLVENVIRRIKTFRIMSYRYRNRLRKYDLANSIVCGLVNLRILGRMAATA